MDWLTDDGKIVGVDWIVFWTAIGWSGNAVFFSRFVVQWYATEKKKQVVVPALFWWLSLTGSLLLLLYALFYDRHYVIIFAYLITWIPYTRNLIIHYRHKKRVHRLRQLREKLPAAFQFLPELRYAAGGDYFVGVELVAGDCVRGIPYFFRMGWKSGCD
jgi:lipid-A-disaccharide synthase-like uncharacterized protein